MLTLRAGHLEADVAPEAGMVVASLRRRGDELLGVRGGLDGWRREGRTFGVPLLYPFANRLSAVRSARIDASAARRDGRFPIHGLPAARGPWEVVEDTPERVRGRLRWDDPAFPPAHVVEVEHALDARGLRVTTRVLGEGVPVSFGWHPYLALDRARDEVEIPAMRRLVLDADGLPTGAVEDAPAVSGLLGDRAFDDLYEAPGAPLRAGRVAVVFERGVRYAQVFAPPGEPLIAFEPMSAPVNALVSGDGLQASPYEMAFRLEVAA
ncbi:MAG: aldose 1-epimerase [Solirubrobacteraceae bacterium]|nr:aldose 1-epimerase [Solirubrobacteraceae bacterium]